MSGPSAETDLSHGRVVPPAPLCLTRKTDFTLRLPRLSALPSEREHEAVALLSELLLAAAKRRSVATAAPGIDAVALRLPGLSGLMADPDEREAC